AQPLVSALAHLLRPAVDAAALEGLVICTAHGAALLPDAGSGDPSSQPDQAPVPAKAPDCAFCALCCDGAAKVLPARVAVVHVRPMPLANAGGGQGAVAHVPRRSLRLVTSPPRAPPRAA